MFFHFSAPSLLFFLSVCTVSFGGLRLSDVSLVYFSGNRKWSSHWQFGTDDGKSDEERDMAEQGRTGQGTGPGSEVRGVNADYD